MSVGIKITSKYNFTNNSIFIGSKENSLSICDINEINRLLSLKKIKNKQQYFEKILFALNANENDTNNLINFKNKQKYLSYLRAEIKNSKEYLTKYFTDVLPLRLDLLKKIKTLKNCTKTVYDHNTVTGRLKVTSGTNFLTMKQSQRKLLVHENKNRIIQEIDFNSCEPNFYLKSKGIHYAGKDIYTYLMEKFDIKSKRSDFKRGILTIIYGANENTVSKLSKIPISKIKKIKKFFDIENFAKSLNEEVEKYGFIKNFYGRPLLSKNNLVNHWIQSSTADYCCLAFSEYLNQNNDVELHGIIHDAIIVSSNKKVSVNTIKENISNIEISVSIKILSS